MVTQLQLLGLLLFAVVMGGLVEMVKTINLSDLSVLHVFAFALLLLAVWSRNKTVTQS
jgi:hypothetical protein